MGQENRTNTGIQMPFGTTFPKNKFSFSSQEAPKDFTGVDPAVSEAIRDKNHVLSDYARTQIFSKDVFELDQKDIEAFQNYDPRDPDDYKRDVVNRVFRSVTQIDDPEGKLLNGGDPVKDTDKLYKMVFDTLHGSPYDYPKLAQWKAIPEDSLEERFKLAQSDKGWWERQGDKLFTSLPDLTEEEAASAGEDVVKAMATLRKSQDAKKAWTEGKKTRDAKYQAAVRDIVHTTGRIPDEDRKALLQRRKEADEEFEAYEDPKNISTKDAENTLKPHRELKQKKATIDAYEQQLHAQNAYAMASAIMPSLSTTGRMLAREVVMNGGFINGEYNKDVFGALPEEDQELIASLANSAKAPEYNALVSAFSQMTKRFATMPAESAEKLFGGLSLFQVDQSKASYDKRVDARLRATNSLNTEEFGFWGNATVAVGDTVPYMVYNALFSSIKYVGPALSFAFLMPSYMNQIEEKIAMSGGDVTSNTAKIASFAGSFAQVAIERLQMAGWWNRITNKGAKDFAMRTAFMEFAKKAERIAWEGTKNFGKELSEEVWQRGAEEVAASLGAGEDGMTVLRTALHGMWNEANESFGAILLMSGGSSVIEGAQNMRGRFQLSTQDLIGIEKTALKLRENLEKGEFNGIKASYKDIAYLARSIMDSPNPVAKAQELGLSEDGAKWLAGTMAGAMEGVNSSSALSQAQKDELLQYRSFTAAEFLKNNFANSEVTENEDGSLDVSMQVTNRTGETDTVKFRVIQDEKVGTLTAEIIDNMDANLAQSVVSYFKGQGVDIGAVNEETLLTMPPEERRAFFTAHPVRVNGKFSMTAPGVVVTDADINTLNGWITVDPQDIGTSFHEAMHGFMRWMVDTKQFSGEELDALVTKYGKGSGAMPWNDETFARDYHTYMNSRAARGEFIRTKSELVFDKIGASLSKLGGYLTFWRKRQGNIEAASNNILEAARRGNFSGVKFLFSEASLMPSEIQSDYTAADAEAEANASAQADADDAANAQNSVDSEEFKGIKTSELKAKAQSEERILENKNLPEEEIEQHAQLLDRVSAELERRFNSRTPAQRAAVTRMRRGRMENTLLGTLNRFNEEQPGNPILELIAEGMGVLTKPRGPGTNHKGQNKFLRKGETPRSSDYGYDSLSDLPPKLAKLLFKEDSFGGVDGDLEELALMPGFQMYAGDNAELFARDVLNQWSKFEQWEEEQNKRSKPQYWEEDGVSGEYAIMDAGDIPAIGMGEVLAGIEANAYSVDFPILSASGELIVGNSENFVITTAEIAEKHGILLDENIKRPVLVRIASPETSADALRSLNESNDFDDRFSVTGAEAEAVVAEYQGTDKWMKAPNGENTNLNERQWIQVQTPSFKKWFNGSKVVDENGDPRVVYHGTPSGGFNEFKPRPTYFTEKQDGADVYHSPSASSIRAWIEEGSPETYEVFINAKNPFDTRKAKHRRQYENEFFGKSGEEWVSNGTPLSERRLPDWTDGSDLAEWINETGQAYDAVILDEGSLPQEDGSVKWRGASWMIPNPSGKTIKSATANTGAFDSANDDIRYSIRGREDLDMESLPPTMDEAYTVTTLAKLYKTEGYNAAKNEADAPAAKAVVDSFIDKFDLDRIRAAKPDMLIVTDTYENGGKNVIPHLLADALGQRLGLPIIYSASHSKGGSNTKVSVEKREGNWHEFTVEDVAGKNVLIVDDVYTSGDTVLALAAAIKRAGGNPVMVTTLTQGQGGKGIRPKPELR